MSLTNASDNLLQADKNRSAKQSEVQPLGNEGVLIAFATLAVQMIASRTDLELIVRTQE